MTNPTQESLDHVAWLNGYRDWGVAERYMSGLTKAAMRRHALDRDKWLAERQPVNWQDNMDFQSSEEALALAVNFLHPSNNLAVIARLIDHLEGTAPEKVDRATDEARKLIEPIWQHGTPSRDDVIAAVAGKLKEMSK